MFDRDRDHRLPTHSHISDQPTFGDVVCWLWRCLVVSVVPFDHGRKIQYLVLVCITTQYMVEDMGRACEEIQLDI